MQTDTRRTPAPTQSQLDEMIVRVVHQLNGKSRRPLATPRLIAEFLGPQGRRNPGPVNVPILDSETFAYLHPDQVSDRIALLLRDRLLRATRSGRIYLPKPRGPLL